MTLTLDDNKATYQIRAFSPGTIQVNELTLTQSIIIAANTLITDWQPQVISELTAENLARVKALQPTILLIGTGATLRFPAIEVYGDLINQGIGVEIMSTRAACRTYNVLTAENRRVVAALIIK